MLNKSIVLLMAILVFCLPPSQAWASRSEPFKVLVIHSFHKGNKWDDDLGLGIKEGLEASPLHIDIAYEYMDSQRFPDDNNYRLLYQDYAYKYLAKPPNVVVTTDENALKFILKYHDILFPDIPVVFCGIKYFDENWLYGEKKITGIVEKVDIGKNIELARRLNPDLEKLLVIVDNSDTSIASPP